MKLQTSSQNAISLEQRKAAANGVIMLKTAEAEPEQFVTCRLECCLKTERGRGTLKNDRANGRSFSRRRREKWGCKMNEKGMEDRSRNR